MAYQNRSYVEHTAIRVKDINWHIKFFKEVFAMPIRMLKGPEKNPDQVWIYGGIQFISDPIFKGPEGRSSHLGIMVENQEKVLDEAYSRGVTELPQGRNWFQLPDGLCIEVLQAKEGSVAAALAITPWIN